MILKMNGVFYDTDNFETLCTVQRLDGEFILFLVNSEGVYFQVDGLTNENIYGEILCTAVINTRSREEIAEEVLKYSPSTYEKSFNRVELFRYNYLPNGKGSIVFYKLPHDEYTEVKTEHILKLTIESKQRSQKYVEKFLAEVISEKECIISSPSITTKGGMVSW